MDGRRLRTPSWIGVFVITFIATTVLATSGGAEAATSKCDSARLRAASDRVLSDLTCHQKAALRGSPVDLACLQKAERKLAEAFAKAERAGDCGRVADDEFLIAGVLRDFVDAVAENVRPRLEASECAAAKLAAVGKSASRRLLCSAKAVLKDLPVDPACLDEAAEKLSVLFDEAEGLGDCFALGDAAAIDEAVVRLAFETLAPGEIEAIQNELARITAGQASRCAPAQNVPALKINVFEANGVSDLQIDQSFDVLHDYSALKRAGGDDNFTVAETLNATPQEVLDHLSRLNQEDVWIFSGHSRVDDDGKVVGISARENGQFQRVSTADLDRALRADGKAPGVAFLDVCSGAQLLGTFIAAGTQVAIGWDKTVTAEPAAEAVGAFWTSEMFAGERFGHARQAAQDRYREVQRANRANLEALIRMLDDVARQVELPDEARRTRAEGLESIAIVTAELNNPPTLQIRAQEALGDVTGKRLEDILSPPKEQ